MSLDIVYDVDGSIAQWTANLLPDFSNVSQSLTFGIFKEKKLIAGSIYNNYHPGVDIQWTLASISPAWCSRRVLKEILGYPFFMMGDGKNVKRISTVTSCANDRSLDAQRRVGFVREGILRDGLCSGDAIIASLTKNEYLERYMYV